VSAQAFPSEETAQIQRRAKASAATRIVAGVIIDESMNFAFLIVILRPFSSRNSADP
jgi:hypothetical protein